MTRERRIPPPDRNALRTQSLILRTTGFFLLPLLPYLLSDLQPLPILELQQKLNL